MRGKEGVAEKVSEGKAKEEEASTAPLPEKVSTALFSSVDRHSSQLDALAVSSWGISSVHS